MSERLKTISGGTSVTFRGSYSLIQFVPNASRSEGANVGVVVVCPVHGSIGVAFAPDNSNVRRLFGETIDDERLTIAKLALGGRLRSDLAKHVSASGIRWVRELESGPLQLLEPRTVVIDEGAEETAAILCRELVQ